MNRKIWLFAFAVVVIVLAVCGCSEDKLYGELPGEWEIGATTIYDVLDNGEIIVEDTNTGYSFRFPDGGTGTLEVGSIISGPEAQFDGEEIYVDYDGSDMIELLVPVENDSSYAYVAGYGSDYGSFSDENGYDDKWHGLAPRDTIAGKAVFQLMMPINKVSKGNQSIRGNSWKGFNHYHVTQLDPSSLYIVSRTAFESQVIDYVWEIIPLLTETLRNTVQTKWRVSHKPTYFLEGNYYRGFFYWLVYNQVWPRISVSIDATFDNIAHETGHYMHHLIAGDAAFNTIFESIPQVDHGIPDLHDGRITIGEDYAYIFQYFLTGFVNTWDPTEPYDQFRNLSPWLVDFPSLEGFGCALLASLERTTTSIRDQVTGNSIEIPVVGASFSDIFRLISYGATNINELRVDVERFLNGIDGNGEADKLPVILHRLGWRYSVDVTIVDQDGNPMPGVVVKFVAKVAGSPDYVEDELHTDSNGDITYTRCFGGDSFIRVVHDGNSTDVPININWSHPTNEEVDLGEIVVTSTDLSKYHKTRIRMNVSGTVQSTEPDGSTSQNFRDYIPVYSEILSGSFSGNTFHHYSDSMLGDANILTEVTAIIDPASLKVTSYEYSYKRTESDGDWDYDNISVSNIPISNINYLHENIIVSGTQVCNHINNFEKEHVYPTAGRRTDFINHSCSDVSNIEIWFWE